MFGNKTSIRYAACTTGVGVVSLYLAAPYHLDTDLPLHVIYIHVYVCGVIPSQP